MSEQPDTSTNGTAPPIPSVLLEPPTGFGRIVAMIGILIGIGVIILSLDDLTGGRLFGFVGAPQQEE